jgi:hypothetical protein
MAIAVSFQGTQTVLQRAPCYSKEKAGMNGIKGGHKWRPGQSGNPAGRKPGTGAVSKLRAGIAEHMPEILNQLVSAAKRGDVQASRLLLERVLPPIRASELPVVLETHESASLAEQGAAVLRAVASGEIPPSQGGILLSAIATLAKVVEFDDLVRRVNALEEIGETNA